MSRRRCQSGQLGGTRKDFLRRGNQREEGVQGPKETGEIFDSESKETSGKEDIDRLSTNLRNPEIRENTKHKRKTESFIR